jgi:hypothetical protein
MTPTEKIFQVLIEHLGQADAIRFLQQIRGGISDYTAERSKNLQSVTREDFGNDLERIRNQKQG